MPICTLCCIAAILEIENFCLFRWELARAETDSWKMCVILVWNLNTYCLEPIRLALLKYIRSLVEIVRYSSPHTAHSLFHHTESLSLLLYMGSVYTRLNRLDWFGSGLDSFAYGSVWIFELVLLSRCVLYYNTATVLLLLSTFLA